MEIKEIEVFKYDELSEESQDKALRNHNENNQFDYLGEDLESYLDELLEENNIKGDAKLFYSLSYSQGDGVRFEGNFEYKKFNISVKNSGLSCHKYNSSITIEGQEDSDDEIKNDVLEMMRNNIENDFKDAYKQICDKIEVRGYDQIEHEQSKENFEEICDANEYKFRIDGTLE